ncbi:MAG: Zn-ribbon domain-containing OB-fold protein [Candidatus Rokuibacteriota bacterium]
MTYFRAVDPLPLQSVEHTKLHEFYTNLAAGRLTTTRCGGCGRLDWPPRGFCPDCAADDFEWVDLPRDGIVHGFTVQETGVPAGFTSPLVFAVVKVGGLRVFAPVLTREPAALAVGARVRFVPVRVADDPKGAPRHLVAFEPE